MPNEKQQETAEQGLEHLSEQRPPEPVKPPHPLPARWTKRGQRTGKRAQARRLAAEKTSVDHAYLMLGAVPFWAVAATSLQNALILCAVLVILMLPASALLGASLLLLADAVSRTIVAPAELPIGIVTAAVGAPFFLWILLRRRGILDL